MFSDLFLEKETAEMLEAVIQSVRYGRRKMLFFGAGRMAKGFIEQYCLEKNLLPLPAYICDNAHGLWGSNIAGVDIVSPERLKDESVDEVVIVMAQVLPFTMLDELQSTHEAGGLQRYYHLVLPLSQLEAYLFYQENHSRVQAVYSQLADERSKYVYQKYFQYLMEGNLTFSTIFTANSYWGNDLIGKLKDEMVIVYAGAYDGEHLYGALLNNPQVELHGFEPDKNCTTRLNEKYSQFSNVHIYPWGLGKERHTAYFDNTTAASSLTVSSINRPGRSYDTIEVVPLDEVLSGQVDMIALDIEGDEVEALLGAERIIRENKPILAICVYHRMEHYVEVAETIQKLCPGYTFYFRQHSIVPHESVLYAIYGEQDKNIK